MKPDDNKNTKSGDDKQISGRSLNSSDILNGSRGVVDDAAQEILNRASAIPSPTPINSTAINEPNSEKKVGGDVAEANSYVLPNESILNSDAVTKQRYSFQSSALSTGNTQAVLEEHQVENKEDSSKPEEQNTTTSGLRELEEKQKETFEDPTELALKRQEQLRLNKPSETEDKDKKKLKLVKGKIGRSRIDKLDREASKLSDEDIASQTGDNIDAKDSTKDEEEEDKDKKKVKRRKLKLVGGGRSFQPISFTPTRIPSGGGGTGNDEANRKNPASLATKAQLERMRKRREEEAEKLAEKQKEKEKAEQDELNQAVDQEGPSASKPDQQAPEPPQNSLEQVRSRFQNTYDDVNKWKQRLDRLSSNSTEGGASTLSGEGATAVEKSAGRSILQKFFGAGTRGAVSEGASGIWGWFVRLLTPIAEFIGASVPVIISIIAVILIVLSIIALITAISSLAATANVTEQTNTTGQARAFFKIYDVDAQLNDVANHGNPIVVEVTSDAAGNQYLKSINFAVSYQLNSVDVYNEKYLGKNSPYYVQVEDASIQFQLVGIPQDILDQATPFLSIPGIPSQLYPTVGYDKNLYLWQPLICADKGIFSQLKSNGYQNKYCATYPQLPEKAYFTFEWPDNTINVTNFTQQVYIQSNPKVTLGNYLKDGKRFLGPYDLTDPQGFRACLSIYGSNPGFVDCGDNIEAAAAIAGAPKVTGNVDGEIASGCPFAYYRSKGEKLQCTAGFNYTVSETNGKHNANDVTVYDSANSKLTDRSILSPVKGKVIATNSDLPGYFNQCGLYLQIQDASDSNTSYMIAHLDWKVWGDVLPTVGDEIQLDQNLGPAFNPPTPGSRSYGKWSPCWTGEHVHFAIYKNGQPIDPKPYIAQKCNQLDYTCPER